MAALCRNLEQFVDGELEYAAAAAFREHLLRCSRCQAALGELFQLSGLVDRYQQRSPSPAMDRAPSDVRARRGASLQWRLAAGALPLVAAAVIAFVLVERAPIPDALWMPAGSVRLIEGRSSCPRATGHRPIREATLGGGNAAAPLPHALLARLPSGDDGALALAAAYLVRGQPALAEAALQTLEPLDESADVESERALAHLVRGAADRGDYEEALRRADAALDEAPRHGPALWNKALALHGLGLDMLAARTFDAVAELGEPGWSQEARGKADQLRTSAAVTRNRWYEMGHAGGELVASGRLPPHSPADSPILRNYLYEAVLSRTSPRDVEALIPLARDLDAFAGGEVLEDYVRKVARRDFSVRAPFARRYLELATGSVAAGDSRLVADLLGSTEDDIVIGTRIKVQALPGGKRERAAFQGTLLSADPWFHALFLQREAAAAQQAGDLPAARRMLEEALVSCQLPGLEFRCVDVEYSLSDVLLRASELDEAYLHAIRALQRARQVGEWGKQVQLLELLAQLARVREDAPLVRAYLEETLELTQRGDNKAQKLFAHGNLALAEMRRLHVDAARQQIDLALATGLPLSMVGAAALADIARVRREEGDAAAMEAFRAGISRMPPGRHALAMHVVGRFLIEVHRAEGRQLLEDVIAQVEALATPGEEDLRAVSYSYMSLILADGRDGNFAAAWSGFEEEAGVALPARCMVAAAIDMERTLIVVRSASGGIDGSYDESRRSPVGASVEGMVPARLLAALSGCDNVQVLARAPLYGRAGLLPRDIAWSYVLPRARGKHASDAARGGTGLHLIVEDVALSARRRQLAAIGSWGAGAGGRDGDEWILSGAAATPAAVLRQVENASAIDIVAHGLVDPISAEAYLVLAADHDGDALRASQLERAVLRHHPVVVLASCGAAKPGPQIESPRSLPAAFLRAGARAVLAAAADIPEREGPAFFSAVRQRIDAGSTPARALRDVRESWIAQSRGRSWLDSVLLFE